MKYFCVLSHCYVKTNGDSVLIINPQTKQYVYSTSSTIVESFVKNKDSYSYCIFDENDEFYLDAISKELGYIIVSEFPPYNPAKNGADCYSKNGDAVTVLTWQS